jgi:hypothetical protein
MKICESGPVICRASGQASADTLNETCPCLTCDHEAPIVAGAYWLEISLTGIPIRTDAE